MAPFRHGRRRSAGLTALGVVAAGLGLAVATGVPAPSARAAGSPTAPSTSTTSRAALPQTGSPPDAISPSTRTATTGGTGLPSTLTGSGAGTSTTPLTGTGPTSSTTPTTTATSAGARTPTPVSIQVSSQPVNQPLPAGFLGFSIEFSAIHAYLGRDPANLNPVFAQLVEGLAQGQPPILRIGGNSSDQSWLPLPGVLPPLGVNYAISPDWLATVGTFARATDTRLTLGVNLGADDPQMAAVEGRAFLAAIGRQHLQALEIGNEPDLYTRSVWYYPVQGAPVYRRVPPYSAYAYDGEFRSWRTALPDLPLSAGTLAALNWLPNVTALAEGSRGVAAVTVHRYPLTNCPQKPDSPYYPTQANLFDSASTSGVAAPLGTTAQSLHRSGINLRVDELNSASCEGAPGLSNSFASALWVVDALYNLAAAGVDGINLHTLPGAAYAPFSFSDSGGGWTGTVHPVYYGMLLFARAFPPGATMLGTSDSSADDGGDVKAYATLGPDGTVRTTILNEDPTNDAAVTLQLPLSTPLDAQRLTAPSLTATDGISLGDRSFASPTRTGTLAAPSTDRVSATDGAYHLTVPAGSAVLLSSGA